jgi:hypothetical protein
MMSDYRVTQDFAFEGHVYHVGDILRLSDPLEARVIREWPWPSNLFSDGAGYAPGHARPYAAG